MAMNMISNMSAIKGTYSVSAIITNLIDFAKKHQVEYQDALEIYQKDVRKKVKEIIREMNKAAKEDFKVWNVYGSVGLTAPVNCEKEYQKLISIFSRMAAEEIELNLDEANRIFNNDWDWVVSASATNTFYSSRKSA